MGLRLSAARSNLQGTYESDLWVALKSSRSAGVIGSKSGRMFLGFLAVDIRRDFPGVEVLNVRMDLQKFSHSPLTNKKSNAYFVGVAGTRELGLEYLQTNLFRFMNLAENEHRSPRKISPVVARRGSPLHLIPIHPIKILRTEEG